MQLSHLPAASALLASPKQASAMPARPTPNFLSAARRVTDWAMPLVRSSNGLFIILLSFVSPTDANCLFMIFFGIGCLFLFLSLVEKMTVRPARVRWLTAPPGG